MRNGHAPENGTRFEYIFDDPVSEGKWKILSHEALTAAEIQRKLRFAAAHGRQRPAKNQTILLRWPKANYRE